MRAAAGKHSQARQTASWRDAAAIAPHRRSVRRTASRALSITPGFFKFRTGKRPKYLNDDSVLIDRKKEWPETVNPAAIVQAGRHEFFGNQGWIET
mgnify:CR=1 FL=1